MELIAALTDSNSTLYSLVPFLEEVLEFPFATRISERTQVLIHNEADASASREYSNYLQDIRNMFPHLGAPMAADLAFLNWNRHLRVQSMANDHGEGIQEQTDIYMSTEGDDPVSCEYLGYLQEVRDRFPRLSKSMANDLASLNWNQHLRIQSMADEYRKGLSVEPSADTASGRSIVLSAGEDGSSGSSIGTEDAHTFSDLEQFHTFPDPPGPTSEHSRGLGFTCTICFQPQSGIHTKSQWMYVDPIIDRIP